MTTLTVKTSHEIALDIPEVQLPDGTTLPALGVVRFPVVGPVRPSLVSVFPPKQVDGDFTRDSEQIASSHIFESFTGGVGVLHMNPTEEAERFWDSSLNTLYRNQVTLNWLPLDTGRGDAPVNAQARTGFVLAGNLYVAFDEHLKEFNDGLKSWGADLHVLPQEATDSAVYNGVAYVAYGSGLAQSSDGATWTDDVSTPVDYVTVYDDRFWTIDKDGANFRAWDGIGWTSKGSIKGVSANEVTGLGTFYAADDSEVVYAYTTSGPFLYDESADKWRRPKFKLPRQRGSGLGHTVYLDNLYMSAGQTVFEFTGTTETRMGLDKDWGLPNYLNGQIVWLTESSSLLIAVLDSTKATPLGTGKQFSAASVPGWGGTTFYKQQGYSSVWAWNSLGWHNVWKSSATGSGATWAYVVDAYGDTRLYIGADNRVYMVRIPDGIINPLQQAVLPYAQSGELITPWFDAQWSELDKVAIRLRTKGDGITATETVTVYYATNDSEQWTLLGTITQSGYLDFEFVNSTGLQFKDIRFKIVMARGSDATKTPVLKFGVVKYLKVLDPMFGYTTTLNLNDDYDSRSPAQLVSAIEQALRAKALIPFAYRDMNDMDQTKFVRLDRMMGSQEGGNDPRGRYDVSFLEV